MKKWGVTIILFLMMAGRVEAIGKVLEIKLRFDKNQSSQVKIAQVKLMGGSRASLNEKNGEWRLVELDANDKELSSLSFSVPNKIYSPPSIDGGPVKDGLLMVDNIDFKLYVLVQSGVAKLRVLNNVGKTVDEWGQSLTGIEGMGVGQTSQTEQKLKIVFIGQGFKDTADLRKWFDPDVEMMSQSLLKFTPFKERANQISFTKIDNLENLDCGRFSADIPRLVYCRDQTKIMNKVTNMGVDWDYIVVIYHDLDYGGGGGFVSTVSDQYLSSNGYDGLFSETRNLNQGTNMADLVFVHEFGHSFGGLMDEYVTHNEGLSTTPLRNENCWNMAPPNPDWEGLVAADQYYKGCSASDWYRSTDDSIMRSLWLLPGFNEVSKRQLDKKLESVVGRKLGDFNGDGRIDLGDFSTWKMDYLVGRKTLGDFVEWKKAYLGM